MFSRAVPSISLRQVSGRARALALVYVKIRVDKVANKETVLATP